MEYAQEVNGGLDRWINWVVLSVQAWEPKSDPQNPHKKLGVVKHICNHLGAEEMLTRGSLKLTKAANPAYLMNANQ